MYIYIGIRALGCIAVMVLLYVYTSACSLENMDTDKIGR